MKRMAAISPPARTAVVCGQKHAALVKKALPKLPRQNVIVEPEARNTAPAIALACAHVAHQDPEGVLVVLPSDQHVADVAAFQKSVEEAIRVAQSGFIVTLGIKPTRPETGYGYISSARGSQATRARWPPSPRSRTSRPRRATSCPASTCGTQASSCSAPT
jgi:mannose-1-phosphate guanylyltransferase